MIEKNELLIYAFRRDGNSNSRAAKYRLAQNGDDLGLFTIERACLSAFDGWVDGGEMHLHVSDFALLSELFAQAAKDLGQPGSAKPAKRTELIESVISENYAGEKTFSLQFGRARLAPATVTKSAYENLRAFLLAVYEQGIEDASQT